MSGQARDGRATRGFCGSRRNRTGGKLIASSLDRPTDLLDKQRKRRVQFVALAGGLLAYGVLHKGVASYGKRPTVDNGPPLLEIYILDFSGDLYGKAIEVRFVGWIRPELKFDGLDALVHQIEDDVVQARGMLG